MIMNKRLKNINEYFETNIEPFIFRCDFFLVNGNDSIIGLQYRPTEDNAPRIVMKYTGAYAYFISVMVRDFGFPCYESKILVNAIVSSKLNDHDSIPARYWRKIAVYYSKLNNNESYQDCCFENELNKDFAEQYHASEGKKYKKAVNKILKINKFENIGISDIEQHLKRIAKEYDYKFSSIKKSSDYSEFFLRKNDDFGRSLIKYVSLSKDSKKIFVGNLSFMCCFDFKEAGKAVKILETLIITETSDEMKECWKNFYDEFRINSRLLDIARLGIQTILKYNRDNTGIKYIDFDHAKTGATILLEKENYILSSDDTKKRMYVIVISYNEFLRNPDEFRAFIESPKPKYNWNFWCREQKYKEEYFQ